MTTGIFTHKACLQHDTGPGHPEQIARLQAIHDMLNEMQSPALKVFEAPQAAEEWIRRVHPQSHIDHIKNAEPDDGYNFIDSDTVMSPGSYDAALHAAGAICAAIDHVMKGEIQNAFCAVRPPGHHAEPSRAMGFCFFNNIAIGARYAQSQYNLRKIAIVDFDVHHGNGTQAAFWNDPDILFISSHEGGIYPGTGFAHETGAYGNILNLPLPHGAGPELFQSVYEEKAFPRLKEFAPEMILVSAGFDAHRDDPLAGLQLTEADFFRVTKETGAIAKNLCKGRIISTLEGGYNLAALKNSVKAHLEALIEM